MCPQGEYLPAGDIDNTECLPCPTSTGTTGQCIDGQFTEDCLPGYYCQDGSAYPCPAGTYTDSDNLVDVSGCTPCDAGRYCDESGMTSATITARAKTLTKNMYNTTYTPYTTYTP
jgi:hypothetical protein